MKFKHKITIVLLNISFLSACSKDKNSSGVVGTKEEKFKETSAVTGKPVGTEKLLSKTNPLAGAVICKETEAKNPDSEDPILFKSCTFGKYRTVSTGAADYNGRYSYEYALYILINGKKFKINNSELFNEKQSDLLKQINQKLKEEYLISAADTNNAFCFEGQAPFQDFTMDQLGITFDENKMVFHVSYGFPGACMSVDGGAVAFPFKEIELYLNK